jgi:phosphosulfolactate synthase
LNQQLKAWDDIISLPLHGRIPKKPNVMRNSGITMIIDKGLSLAETASLLSVGSDYADLIKFGFGTSAFYSSELLQEKVKLIQSYQCEPYPGGTFLEVAVMQGKLAGFLKRAEEFGFRVIEISDGTISMSDEVRNDIIHTVLSAGFKVITEVGKKNPLDKISRTKIIQQILSDLENGAWKVIVEGRESGKGVGVYNQQGEIDEKSLEDIVDNLPDQSALIWEAPLKNQQQALIERFGVNINLGNIPTNEILALEALRVGLRGDTLRQVVKNSADYSYSFIPPSQTISK